MSYYAQKFVPNFEQEEVAFYEDNETLFYTLTFKPWHNEKRKKYIINHILERTSNYFYVDNLKVIMCVEYHKDNLKKSNYLRPHVHLLFQYDEKKSFTNQEKENFLSDSILNSAGRNSLSVVESLSKSIDYMFKEEVENNEYMRLYYSDIQHVFKGTIYRKLYEEVGKCVSCKDYLKDGCECSDVKYLVADNLRKNHDDFILN